MERPATLDRTDDRGDDGRYQFQRKRFAMTSSDKTPQPGAQKNPMLNLGMTHRDVEQDGWPKLDKDNAPNFVANASPVMFEKGQTLFRVYGGSAKMNGAYWSPEPPAPKETEAQWRSENAIEYSWNAGQFVASYTATKDIPLWTGSVEAQPAQSLDNQILPDYWLVGGGPQFFFPYWLIDGFAAVAVGDTPWAGKADTGPVAPEGLAARVQDVDPADANAAQAFRVSALADAIRASADALRVVGTDTADEMAALEGAVANLMSSANAILRNLDSDPQLVGAAIRSQVGLARHIRLEAETPGHDEVHRRLGEVIHGAAVISGKA